MIDILVVDRFVSGTPPGTSTEAPEDRLLRRMNPSLSKLERLRRKRATDSPQNTVASIFKFFGS